MSGNGTQKGRIDASLGRPKEPQGNRTHAEYQNYIGSYNGTKK